MRFEELPKPQQPSPKEIAKIEKSPSQDSQREVVAEKYREILEKIPRIGEKLQFQEEKNERRFELDQPISWKHFAFVRADSEFPTLTSDKELRILSPYEKEGVPRITSHYSMNHKVMSHLYGSWETSPYLIIMPAEGTIAQNGKPENLYAIDTFWVHGVTLPKDSVVVCIKGNAVPELPSAIRDKIHIIEVEPAEEKTILSLVLERMNVAELKGGTNYSEEGGVDDLIAKLAIQEHVEHSSPHVHHWTEVLEKYADPDYKIDPEQLEEVFKQRGYAKIPDELKKVLVKQCTELFQAGEEYRKNKNKIFGFIRAILRKEFGLRYDQFVIEAEGQHKGRRQYQEPVSIMLNESDRFKVLEEEGFIEDAKKEMDAIHEMQTDFISDLPDEFWKGLMIHLYRREYGMGQPSKAVIEKFNETIVVALQVRVKEFLGDRYDPKRWEKALSFNESLLYPSG